MKSIICDIRRAVARRWFAAAIWATALFLWMSAGWQAQRFVEVLRSAGNPEMDLAPDWPGLLHAALSGEFGLLILPAVSALPFAAEAVTEIRSGAFRPAVFRTGWRAYIAGRAAACVFSGAAVQLGGLALLWTILALCSQACGLGWPPLSAMQGSAKLLTGRALCGGLWACAGSAAALLTATPGAAYLAPLCLCYALRMLGTRFFPQFGWLDASLWPAGDPLLPLGLMLAAAFSACAVLRREVNRHA